MNKILVTGATGFIGKHFIQQLLQKKIQIRVLIRDTQKSIQFPKEVEIFRGDLTDAKSLVNACTDIETVYHLGGYAHAWAENNRTFADQHHAINFQGTQNILQEALNSGVKKFIFFSSVKAVADSENCIDENWDNLPNTPYGLAKRKAEEIVLAAKNSGMHVCVLRPALVYGPNWKGNLENMLRAVARGVFPPLPETKNCRSMISVNDICQAACLAALNPEANGKIYFVTDGVDYSTRQLYVLMRNALGKRIPIWHIPLWFFKLMAGVGDLGQKIIKRRLPFNSDAMTKLFGSAQYSSERIRSELGFKPIYDLKKMLPNIVKSN